MPDGAALRFDDIWDGWGLTSEPDNWTQQLIIDLPASRRRAWKYYRFLGYQVGKDYDMRQLAGVRYHFENLRHDRWSCAVLLLAALVEAGILRKPPPLLGGVSVRDLMIAIAATMDLPAIEYRQI